MNIGENIRKRRKDKKLTLKALGIKVGLSEQAIGQYERGDRTPSIITLEKIAATLGTSLSDFVGNNESIDVSTRSIECIPKTLNDYSTKELLEEIKRRIEGEE